MNHLSNIQLSEYADRQHGATEFAEMEAHLRSCMICTRKLREMERFDRVAARALREKAPAELESKVFKRLGIQEAPSMAWDILKSIAPAFALLLVVGIVIGALYVTGALQPSDFQNQVLTGQTIYAQAAKGVNGGVVLFDSWVKSNTNSITVVIGLGTLLLVVLIFDKTILMPRLRGRN
jgi:anti-sigma factor RsiW